MGPFNEYLDHCACFKFVLKFMLLYGLSFNTATHYSSSVDIRVLRSVQSYIYTKAESLIAETEDVMGIDRVRRRVRGGSDDERAADDGVGRKRCDEHPRSPDPSRAIW